MQKLVLIFTEGKDELSHSIILPLLYESKEAAILHINDVIKKAQEEEKVCGWIYTNRYFNYSIYTPNLINSGYKIYTLDEWFEENCINKQ